MALTKLDLPRDTRIIEVLDGKRDEVSDLPR